MAGTGSSSQGTACANFQYAKDMYATPSTMGTVAHLVLVPSLFAYPQGRGALRCLGAPSRQDSTSWLLPILTVHASVLS